MKFDKPILIFIYNRSQYIKKILRVVKKINPPKIYFYCDGPKNEFDQILVNNVRSIVENFKIKSQTKKKYLEKNVGLKNAIINGLNWFFTFEKDGIILEDDCLPHQDFFNFCQENLDYHKNNTQVMNIGGLNILNELYNLDYCKKKSSYFFTSSPMIWGWATWKNRWSKFDPKLKDFKKIFLNQKKRKKIYRNKIIDNFYMTRLNEVYHNRDSSWAYIWDFTLRLNSGLNITPKKNLIKNLGQNISGSHFTPQYKALSLLKRNSLKKITHNNNLIPELDADKKLAIFFDKKSFTQNLRQNISKLKKVIKL